MKKALTILFFTAVCFAARSQNPPVYIAFLWHMHQPIYWPYESVVQTDAQNRYGYSVTDIHNQRSGPYNSWPHDAVSQGLSMAHFGAQVSFSGSLMENLNNLKNNGNSNFSNWTSQWNAARAWTTSLGNPRMDLVGFGYHHPLMGLVPYLDIRKQIQAHKLIFSQNFIGNYSKGIFPPENAFSERMIPAFVDEGFQWVLVDNIHFDRACTGYPFSTNGNVYEMNKADQVNANPADWVALNGLWAPTQNSAKWGRLPHYAQYIDPATGAVKKMIVVPADRYMGNEDARGGYGALNYDAVMSQLASYNTDPNHPILIVLAHDGDNYGGGTDSYYHGNFGNFVSWLQSNPTRFVCTTVQDYLQLFPPDTNDVIHVENGSWSGADNGDPEFLKWNADPSNNYSADRNSWGVITAAQNIIHTAEQVDASNVNTQNGWHYLMNGEASDYWYWDGSQGGIWDAHPTQAANLAIMAAQSVAHSGADLTPPTIYIPQREPYNPGGTEWNTAMPSDFKVWTYAYDMSGLKYVKLKYRTDHNGINSPLTDHNETYAGGSDVTGWAEIAMTGTAIASQAPATPVFKALEYAATITGLRDTLVDYYVEAMDSNNNVAKSAIQHVWVGGNSGSGTVGNPNVSWTPANPTYNDTITITVRNASQAAKLHWGVNFTSTSAWALPDPVYRPAGTTVFSGGGAVESDMSGPAASTLTIKLGPFNNAAQAVQSLAFVIHYNNNTWDNNNNNNYKILISNPNVVTPIQYVMDGNLDTVAQQVAAGSSIKLWASYNGSDMYVASQSAQSQGGDVFIFVSKTRDTLAAAPWAKAGRVGRSQAYLANESNNNFSSWYNCATNMHNAASYLEGTFNVNTAFGSTPDTVYVIAAKYQTPDGGTLADQAPAGNTNGNLESIEWYPFPLRVSTQPTSVSELPASSFNIYPNPGRDRFTIVSTALDSKDLCIYDATGRLVYNQVLSHIYEGIDLSALTAGVYTALLYQGGQRQARQLIILK